MTVYFELLIVFSYIILQYHYTVDVLCKYFA